MIAHATTLELDEAAAGLAADGVREHLESCATCRAGLDRVAIERLNAMADPRFPSILAKLPAARTPRRWLWVALPAAAACAALAVFWPAKGWRSGAFPFSGHASAGLRVKGSASLQLVSSGGLTVTNPRVGDAVELRIAQGARHFVLVITSDGSTVIWPSPSIDTGARGSAVSGALAPAQHLAIALRVTPGPSHLIALFSDRPLGLEDALRQLPPDLEVRRLDVVPRP